MSNTRSAVLFIYFALHLLNLTHGKHLSTHLEVWNLLLSTPESFIWVYITSISAQLLWHHQQMDWVRLISVRVFAIQMFFCRRNRMYTIHPLKLLNKMLFWPLLPQMLQRTEKKFPSRRKPWMHITFSQPPFPTNRHVSCLFPLIQTPNSFGLLVLNYKSAIAWDAKGNINQMNVHIHDIQVNVIKIGYSLFQFACSLSWTL